MSLTNELQPGKVRRPALIIIDDEEQILTSLRSLFRKENYIMHFFSSPLKALEFLEHNEADVIITDMRMPEMNGPELLERSLQVCPSAIKIIISGYEEKSVMVDTLSRGLARTYLMKPWDDEYLLSVVRESMDFQKKMKQKKLDEILFSFRNLPTPTKLHQRIKEVLLKDNVSKKEITSEIEKSPVLVASLMRMANSVFYTSRRPVSSVFEAITFIGVESILNIILCLESFEFLCSQSSNQSTVEIEELRIKSVMRAQLAREISYHWHEKVDPQETYAAALMLDIGLLLRFCCYGKNSDIIPYLRREDNKSIFSVEKNTLLTTHDEVGEALLTFWNFSPQIISAVANHHNYTGDDALITIIQISDLLILGYDSYPHDPRIDKLAEEWELRLKDVIEKIKETGAVNNSALAVEEDK